jgi:dephospho-CoA kinase
VESIGARFPGTVQDGILDREKLAAIVLDDPGQLRLLESIVHPAVQAARNAFIDAHREAPALLFDIPLLFETGGEEEFDTVIVVSAPEDVQRERVLARCGMSPQKFEAILAQQMPDAEKRARADYVIDTGGDLSTTEGQVRHILSCLRIGAGR